MGFLMPKPPKVVTPPQPASTPTQADSGVDTSSTISSNPGSLISTSPQGLTRKARTQKPSLIGSSRAN